MDSRSTNHSHLDRKTLDDVVTTLRKEVKSLREMLKDKTEELIAAEKEIRDRDISICFLKKEFQKLADQCNNLSKASGGARSHSGGKCDNNVNNGGSKDNINRDAESYTNGHNGKDSDSDGSRDDEIYRLERELRERDIIIKELNQKIIRLSDNLTYVQRQSLEKDDKIIDLQNEIDKFRQVVCIIFEFRSNEN